MEIKINNLSKCYKGNKVLNNVSIKINQGVFGLLGENGAGKTTLLEIIAGLIPFDDGEIEIDGNNIKKNPSGIRKKLGYLPQKFDFFPKVTAEEMLDYLCELKGIYNKAERQKEIDLRLKEVGLLNERNKQVKELSGGMKQRLGIAQALIGDPKILIIDEPTVGLDPYERISFRNLIQTISKEKIIILSTHIVPDVESTCDNILVLKKGEIQYIGNIEGLLRLVHGKVWIVEIPRNKSYIYQSKLIISMHDKGNLMQIRYVSDEPLESSINVEPTLEDAYVYLNRRENCI